MNNKELFIILDNYRVFIQNFLIQNGLQKSAYSFSKENLNNNSYDVNMDVPIKSAKSFLYEFWNVYFYLYGKKTLEKFKQIKSNSYDNNLLESLSFDCLFKDGKDDEINSQIKFKDGLNGGINPNFNIINDIQQPTNDKNNLLFPMNNNINLGNNLIYPFNNIVPQINQIPIMPNNLKINNNNAQDGKLSPFGKEYAQKNIPFLQLPISPQLPLSIQNIMNQIPNSFHITNNNTNYSTNINIKKDITNVITIQNDNKIIPDANGNKIQNTEKESSIVNNNQNSANKHLINLGQNKINLTNNIKDSKGQNDMDSSNKIKFTSKVITQEQDNNGNENNANSQKTTSTPPTQINTNIPKKLPLFSTKEVLFRKDASLILSNKKRKRYIKNNKLVFIQLDHEEDKDDQNTINKNNEEKSDSNRIDDILDAEKLNEIIQKNTKPRGSRFRGVSKNGSQWQVLIMVNKRKRYLGSFSNEEEAARAYDRVALQHHGLKAKTNYDYTKEEVGKIINGPKMLRLE